MCSSCVALAGGILNQAGVAGAEDVLGAVAQADLQLPGQDDDKLAAWRVCQSEKRPAGASLKLMVVVAWALFQSGVWSRSWSQCGTGRHRQSKV